MDSRSRGSTRPRPESRDVVQLKSRYGLFIGGKEVAPRSGQWFTTVDPATEEPLAEIARATVEDVDQAVGAARRAFKRDWGTLPGSERAKYLFRIARILQERSREFAVLESLDGGKPIKESRDVDVPLAAAHFWYYAGWADKLEYAFPNRDPQPAWCRGAGHPVELPAADARLEDRARRSLQATRSCSSRPARRRCRALFFADVCRQADLPAGRRQHHHRAGRDRPCPRQASRRGQGGLHRLDVRGQGDRPRRRRARTRRSRSSWAARRPTSSSTTRRSTRRSRAWSTASSSTRARCAAPAAACSSRNRSPSRSSSA